MFKRIGRQCFSTLTTMRRHLSEVDSEVYAAIIAERERQFTGINLIASENYCSNACLAAVGSVLNNKYAEGYPGARYYGGTENVDRIELLCQDRALKAFHLSKEEWGVNVQAHSGSPANMAVYTALLNPYDRIMSLDLSHGGHLSHGFQANGKKISAVSKYFEVYPYRVNEATGMIDYEALHKTAQIYRPKLIVAGASAYSRKIDYHKFREICDELSSVLLVDMAHPAGLIAAQQIPSPFPHADIVTTTTHKTMRGPRGALIFTRLLKDKHPTDYKSRVDAAVFPGLQGGPHMHAIAGIAVALKEACTPQFVEYQKQVLENIAAASRVLSSKGYTIVSGGTDTHLFLVDMRSKGSDGARMEAVLGAIGISINKNTVPGDKSALVPSGIRIGGPAMTTRGCKGEHFEQIMDYVCRATDISIAVSRGAKGTKLKEFKEELLNEKYKLGEVRKEVEKFAAQFPVPGGLL